MFNLLPWPWGTHFKAFFILFTVQYLLQYLIIFHYTCVSSRQVANLIQAMHKIYLSNEFVMIEKKFAADSKVIS